MKPRFFHLVILLMLYSILSGCNAYMHGYTEKQSMNSYNLVTGNKKNFGDRRIKYNKGFHKNSALSRFLDEKGLPGFIYEYKTETKCRGIQLFYLNIDSVFVFEEPRKGNLRSVFKEGRRMDENERMTYERLKTNTE